MFKKILIANRSEIAVRIINACRELDVVPVAVYSQVDRLAKHVKDAPESYALEGNPASVYLDIDQIIKLARRAGADAIHPGYGFLSENPDFARACEKNGIKFIGPSSAVIEKMGSKVEFRKSMEKAGLPTVPGTTHPVVDGKQVAQLAKQWGYPVAIKASSGGGGRGLKLVRSENDVSVALAAAQREGLSYFGSDEVYLEKYLTAARHIEVQVLADSLGNVVTLGERDCSAQRRHQKLLEESPSPVLPAKLREQAFAAVVRAATAIGYTSAGTFEGLISEGKYYLLEVNTRIQVEHPVTEMVTGVDIVKEQILIAAGNRMNLDQSKIDFRGHAIECRINAEDPFRNFLPSPGVIARYVEPRLPWVRIDTACYQGYEVQPFYDSLLAKLVVWGRTRDEAIARMRLALESYVIEGVATTIPFHTFLLKDESFLSGNFFTNSVEDQLIEQFKKTRPVSVNTAGAVPESQRDFASGLVVEPFVEAVSSGADEILPRLFKVKVDGRTFRVGVSEVVANLNSSNSTLETKAGRSTGANLVASTKGRQEVKAPMHGLVKDMRVRAGEFVEAGHTLLIFEAMKMESTLNAEMSGRVDELTVKAGQTVGEGDHLLTIVNEPKGKRPGPAAAKDKRN